MLTATQRRTGWAVLLLTFIGLRIAIPAVLRPVGYIADWNDYYFFEGWARFTDVGRYPYLDFWMEHPPLFPWLVVAAYRLSAIIPAWDNPHLAFSLVFGTILLAFELGNLLLIGWIAGRIGGPDRGLIAGWVWALLFAPIFFWSAGFEGYPLFFLLLALALVLRAFEYQPVRWGALAGLAAGVGIMIKLIPGLIVPVGTFALWRSGRRAAALTLVGAATATVLLIAAPFVAANPLMVRASAESLLARGSWETVWALADGYYSGGAVSRPETRLDPATAGQVERASRVPMLPVLAAAALLGGMLLWRVRRWTERTVVAAAGLAIVLFMLASKGYSPQFLVYLLAPVVLLWPERRGVGYAIVLSAINLVEYPLALLLFADQPTVLVTTVLARTLVLIVLAVDYVSVLWGRRSPVTIRLAAPVSAAILAVLTAVTLSATATYAATRLPTDSAQDAVRLLRERGGTAVFGDRGLYDRLTPLLGGGAATRLVLSDQPPRLPDGDIWDVYIDSEEGRKVSRTLTAALARDRFPVETRVESGLRLTRFAALPLPPIRPVDANLGRVRLVSAALPESSRAGALLPVRLDWQAVETLTADYTVYLHLIDSAGRVAAQRDAPPVAGGNPSTSWPIANLIVDRQVIPLPEGLPAGDYRVRAGLYDPKTGERVQGASGDGADLGIVRVERP
ncbi:MAG: glycosyltransferase 87 family protein [Dehalococcoidia bacterium]